MDRFAFRRFLPGLILAPVIVIGAACSGVTPAANIPSSAPTYTPTFQKVTQYTYRVINSFPHDSSAYTEGLVYYDGFLYESTGLYGKSSLRKVELETGKVLQKHQLADSYFGEGIALFNDTIAQLTWKEKLGFVYERESFKLVREFNYPNEGWGLAYDGRRLIMSDGSAALTFLDPITFSAAGNVTVLDNGVPVKRLNELEFIKGRIYANVWQTDKIAIIDPESGRVEGWVDLTGLLPSSGFTGKADGLNGIAYDAEQDRLFVTGKLWPWLFEIKLVSN